MTLRFACSPSKLAQRGPVRTAARNRLAPGHELGYVTSRNASRCHGVASIGSETARDGGARVGHWRRLGKRHYVSRGIDHMTAIVFAPAHPVRRAATCIAAVTALTLGTLARARAAARAARRRSPRRRLDPASGAAGTEGARRQAAAAACATGSRSARRPAGRNGRAAARGLFAVDQVLRQGQRRRRRKSASP